MCYYTFFCTDRWTSVRRVRLWIRVRQLNVDQQAPQWGVGALCIEFLKNIVLQLFSPSTFLSRSLNIFVNERMWWPGVFN
jgi:hypothetical protein